VKTGEEEYPEWVRVDLHPFADIEDGPVPGEEVRNYPKIDEGILGYPAIAPGTHQRNNERDGQHEPRASLAVRTRPRGFRIHVRSKLFNTENFGGFRHASSLQLG
jgi:hypothetical protein